ncbi:hypothetical protein NQO50_003637 [Vibrio vulnificus]|nr:hypothetical protein [Vibrio vulnificus]EIU7747618.1 hypothetical protein [Vibrio vulnificus]EJN6717285.1 hypothetical protein [Vibrio vulnificus]ELH4920462.1 hypothetical protein [Vibrio vulnificus]HDY7951593.1 hypothetical protein [Vibrio vulnificus]
MRGSIHPHAPDAAFGNTLTATDNNESEASSNTDNEVLKPSHGARYTMGPRVREDDGVRELIRTTSCIPVYTGIHSSTRARSRVWKCTHRNRQQRKRNQQQHG